MENKHIKQLQVASLIILSIALFLAFDKGLPDRSYGALLGDSLFSSMPIDIIKLLSLAALISSTLLIYYLFEDEPFAAWSIALLFVFAPAIVVNTTLLISLRDNFSIFLFLAAIVIGYRFQGAIRAVAILPAALAGYLAYLNFQFLPNLQGIGTAIGLALLAVWFYYKQKDLQPLAWFLAGIFGAIVAFPLAMVSTIVAAGFVLRNWIKHIDDRISWAVFIAAVVFYLLVLTGDGYILFGGIALGIGVVSYLIISLYEMKTEMLGMAIIFMLLVNLGITYSTITREQFGIAPPSIKESWQWLESHDGRVAILKFNNTFAYDMKKTSLPVDLGILLDDRKLPVDYLVFSRNGLYEELLPTGRAFILVQVQGNDALFVNNRYYLDATLSSDGKGIVGIRVRDRATNSESSIPFTKIRPLYPEKPLTDASNLLVNVDGIEESNLYRMLTKMQIVYENNGAYVMAYE